MTLIVDNKYVTMSFIKFLKRRMLGWVALNLNRKRLTIFDEYFKSSDFIRLSNNVTVSSRQVIIMSMTNLIHKRYDTVTHIFVNPNICYPGTNIKLVDLCKIINFGNMSVEGYPIFTETFDHFHNNITKYVDRCIIGLR